MAEQNATIGPDEAWRIAFEGCLAGYPLLVLDAARRSHPAPANQFVHARAGEDPVGLGAPNPHVIYSSAWLDLKDGPVIVSLPDLRAHHCVMPMIDAWGAIFTSMGVRRRGEGAQHLVVVGPGWSGAATEDVPVVRAPTNAVWLLGRTLADPFDDEVDGPWNDYFLTAKGRRGSEPSPEAFEPWPAWPAAAFSEMDAQEFFSRTATLMTVHPAPPEHWSLVQRLARLGVSRQAPFDLNALPAVTADAVRAGFAEAITRIEAAAWPSAGADGTHWATLSRPGGGRLDPLNRAAITRRGFGFNLREDAVYFLGCRDAEGASLEGDIDYRLRFEPHRLPPVGAYWSLAAYPLDGGPYAPTDGRRGLSSRDPLRFDLDGSLDLRIQRRRPAGPTAVNWLPTPDGPFRLILRTYWPGKPVLDGRWTPPPLVAAERPARRPLALSRNEGAGSGPRVGRLGIPPDSTASCGL